MATSTTIQRLFLLVGTRRFVSFVMSMASSGKTLTTTCVEKVVRNAPAIGKLHLKSLLNVQARFMETSSFITRASLEI